MFFYILITLAQLLDDSLLSICHNIKKSSVKPLDNKGTFGSIYKPDMK